MRFKHAFHVFVDNFSITFKHLLYGLIVLAVTVGLGCAIVLPATNNIMNTAQYVSLENAFNELWQNVLSLQVEPLHENLSAIKSASSAFLHMLTAEKGGLFALCVILLIIVYLINRFLVGVGNYTTAALINDKMALHLNSPFTATMIKNIGKASLHSVIYVPLAFVFDSISAILMWAIFFKWLHFLPLLLKIFLFATIMIALIALKMTFTSDWLPALIHAKQNNRKAIAFSFSRKGKNTASVYSTFLVLILVIMALNVAATLFTFGAGLLLTIPASYMILICYEFVNYCDDGKLKYFIDEDTVIGPKKETPPTVEEFFKGED